MTEQRKREAEAAAQHSGHLHPQHLHGHSHGHGHRHGHGGGGGPHMLSFGGGHDKVLPSANRQQVSFDEEGVGKPGAALEARRGSRGAVLGARGSGREGAKSPDGDMEEESLVLASSMRGTNCSRHKASEEKRQDADAESESFKRAAELKKLEYEEAKLARELAAAKIQAIQRGRMTRRQMAAELEAKRKEQAEKHAPKKRVQPVTLKSWTDDEQLAVVRIQSRVRGHSARKMEVIEKGTSREKGTCVPRSRSSSGC